MTTTRVALEDLPLPGMPTPPEPVDSGGVAADEEIPALRRGAARPKGASRRRQPSTDPRRQLVKIPRRNVTLAVMTAAAAARRGVVAELHDDEHHMLAVTHAHGLYELTSESLVDPPWTGKVQQVIDLLTDP